MKSWFQSIRAGASAQEASRDARLGLEEVESEHDFEERLFLEEKRIALSYQSYEQSHHNDHHKRNKNKKTTGAVSFHEDVSLESETDFNKLHGMFDRLTPQLTPPQVGQEIIEFEIGEWGNPKLDDDKVENNKDDEHNQMISTIQIGDIIQALYIDENVWYPAEVIDININGETGEFEFDVKYDGFEGEDAFEYSKNGKEVTCVDGSSSSSSSSEGSTLQNFENETTTDSSQNGNSDYSETQP